MGTVAAGSCWRCPLRRRASGAARGSAPLAPRGRPVGSGPRRDRAASCSSRDGATSGARRDGPRGVIEPAAARLRILVVDDEPAMVGAISALVGSVGHQVVTAYDGDTALRRV